MAVGLAAQIAAARTALAALTPDTASQASGFTETDSLLHVEHTHPTAERWFDVQASDTPPEPTGEMASDSAQFRGEFVVSIRYDAQADLDAMGDRMAEDAENVILAMEAAANRAANVHRVSYKSGSTETLPGEGSHFAVRRLTFECLYRRSI